VKRSPTSRDILPLARTAGSGEEVPTGEAFRTQWIDFTHGIRVGNLEPHQRITKILKYRLEEKYKTGFVTDRWGRGVYWQWICWLNRANRDAKTVSRGVNFGCAKLFISVDRYAKVFQCGLQIERGYAKGHGDKAWGLKKDWDWNRLVAQCRAESPCEAEIRRLVKREGFIARMEGGGREAVFGADFDFAAGIREAARRMPADQWAGFQVFYPIPEAEVRAASGYELVQAVLGAFTEVIPLMNMCVQVGLDPGVAILRIHKG
jgi:hypothetical protein